MADFNIAPTKPRKPSPVARKDADSENFPVASRLLPKHLRPHVMAFYRFVRLGDDIADDPDLEPETKLAYLEALERSLTTGQAKHAYLKPALDLRASLQATGVSDRHPRQVLRAFRRDAVGARCHSWSDLLLYCRFSANPVGRYLLDLHGEGVAAGPASDALCTALQVLNHLQDCREDWSQLGRCYIPLVWFDDSAISVERLVETESDAKLRAIFDRTLEHTDRLLERAAPLPGLIQHRGLRMEASVILSLAESLAQRLRSRDPLKKRVVLGTHHKLFATARGLARAIGSK
ncbi:MULTISPECIES: squalene/phytoene synthase family protein [Azospirillum]|uniref:Squalene/phytoene synthase family protein n=1 Tax=Azospirillum himalayense TaxID=654847 RepID=A0ABW0G7R6_9PROT|nr:MULTISPECIES: squalene/phytoene synthase family protein [unclassified Azospirillum]AWJ86276.1 squalene synthase [Azospirillum sp. TSH58]MBB3264106.1 squalene synthase HpnC [Azospirillum sp. OGB3]PWC60896.1 squalene synthase [Azospirillum sp. TSH58]